MSIRSHLDGNQVLKNSHDEATQSLVVKQLQNLISGAWDYTSQTQTSTTDVWTFKSGGSGGTTVCTITITYTDSTKATISNVART